MPPLQWQTQLEHQLQELYLIQCSLLQDEHLEFLLPTQDLAIWTSLLDTFTNDSNRDLMIASLAHPPCQARFELRIADPDVWFEVRMPRCTEPQATLATASAKIAGTSISVKTAHASRDAHEQWNAEIRARVAEIDDACEFPVYELLTVLTAVILESRSAPEPASVFTSLAQPSSDSSNYHVLLTSHHLISSTKRRSMNHWASQLGLTSGFAKVGYPGVIYAEGPREAIEQFVRNVKGMQWLALRVRFMGPVPDGTGCELVPETKLDLWIEVAKISEVLGQMRMRGRESLITDLGIGTSSREIKNA